MWPGKPPLAAIVPTYQSILGSNLCDVWHASAGVAVTSGEVTGWTGLSKGMVISPSGAGARPAYGADGTAFGGKSVVKCAFSGSRGLRNANVATGLFAGTRPWMFSRIRFRTTPTAGADYCVCDYGRNAASDLLTLAVRSASPFSGTINNALSGPRVNAASAVDQAVHSIEVWADGTNINLALDGAITTSATTDALSADVISIGVGQTATGAYWFCDTSHALHIVCYAYPGAAAVAAVRALAQAEFPA